MLDPITQGLTEDHRRCDHLLALVEEAASGRDWEAIAAQAKALTEAIAAQAKALTEAIAAQAKALTEAIHAHFHFEEAHLFPPLEAQSPLAAGPIAVMRSEHEQILQLLSQLGEGVAVRDADECRGILETLHLLNVQHNGKEEAILYPLADRTLGDRAETLLELLHA